MINQITLHQPLDMHLHLRDKDMLQTIGTCSSDHFSGGLVMPNLVPPVKTIEAVKAYRKRILNATQQTPDQIHFDPYMTLFFDPSYDEAFLREVKPHILAIKLYPAGITTNSDGGVSNFDIATLSPTLNAMSKLNIPLCVHGETDGFVMDREREFAPIYELLATHFPDLTIIMEHITTTQSVDLLDRYDNLYATITLHHLIITLDDMAGGMLKPHLFCKPIAKHYDDRDALLNAAFTHPKAMFGSDSAPHPQHKKECCGCAAGVFTAPIALPCLAQLFDNHDKLDILQDFVSNRACEIYKITPPKKNITLIKEAFEVPATYGQVVPFCAGESLSWSVKV